MPDLYRNTVNNLLSEVLDVIMKAPEFNDFRLVGGTALSLQLGHRMSVDIDLFTDAPYGSVDFQAIDEVLKNKFPYVTTNGGQIGMGTSFFAGQDPQNAVKIDIYYTDNFIQTAIVEGNLRLATIGEIIAMKLDIIARKGRKKDFWDLHALIDEYSVVDMIRLHQERYPDTHDEELIRQNMVDFSEADHDFDPICLKGKHWELIKYDLIHWLKFIPD